MQTAKNKAAIDCDLFPNLGHCKSGNFKLNYFTNRR